jgi:hypothetical protein
MSAPIDKGTLSMPAVVAIVAGAFAVGGWAVSLEVRLNAAVEAAAANGSTLTAICEALDCRRKGMTQ